MTSPLPSLLADSKRLMTEVESAVSDFPRKTQFLLGQDIRKETVAGLLHAQEALRKNNPRPGESAQRALDVHMEVLQKLSDSNDRLKAFLQVAHTLQSFTSTGRFKVVITLASDVGKQCGGLINAAKLKQKHLHGQNPAALVPAGASLDTECPLRPAGAKR